MSIYEQVAFVTFKTKEYKHPHQVKEPVAFLRAKVIYLRSFICLSLRNNRSACTNGTALLCASLVINTTQM